MPNLTAVIKHLEQERTRLTTQLDGLNKALSALGTKTRRGGISAAGRARIAAAQRARWAKVKGQKVVSIASRKRGKMTAAGRRKVAAAQKARWAKWRKAKKG